MSVYTITHGFHFDDVSAVQTLTPSEVQPGDSIVIAGAGAKFNGTFGQRRGVQRDRLQRHLHGH